MLAPEISVSMWEVPMTCNMLATFSVFLNLLFVAGICFLILKGDSFK